MKKANSVEEYIETHKNFSDALTVLRDIIITTELVETLKWSAPVYTINGKNVLGLGAFKEHFGIWFFNGVFLKDEHHLLVNAQEGKTKALRQMRFTAIDDIDNALVLQYIKEAIDNQNAGKSLKTDRSKKETIIPSELQQLFDQNADISKAFNSITPYKQREYCDYIDSAKRETTKQSRLEKITPMILKGMGLHDKYKC